MRNFIEHGTQVLVALLGTLVVAGGAQAGDPPAINPFGSAPTERSQRDDMVPGYIEMSDGTIHVGNIYLTRDARLKIYDGQLERQRLIPLRVLKEIECLVKKEWLEKEWKFKELALDEKMYTGKSYPSREYEHKLTLRDDRTITGPLSAVVYVEPNIYKPGTPNAYRPDIKPEKYLLNKRNKGQLGETLDSLVYVKRIKFGEEALEEGRKKAATQRRRPQTRSTSRR